MPQEENEMIQKEKEKENSNLSVTCRSLMSRGFFSEATEAKIMAAAANKQERSASAPNLNQNSPHIPKRSLTPESRTTKGKGFFDIIGEIKAGENLNTTAKQFVNVILNPGRIYIP